MCSTTPRDDAGSHLQIRSLDDIAQNVQGGFEDFVGTGLDFGDTRLAHVQLMENVGDVTTESSADSEKAHREYGGKGRFRAGIFSHPQTGDGAQLLTYDTSKVMTCSSLMPCGPKSFFDLTVFKDPLHLVQALILTSAAVIIGHVMPAQWVNLDGEINAATASVRSTIGFLLSGFASKVVSTWMSRRKNYQKMLNQARAVLVDIASMIVFVPTGTKEDRQICIQMRSELARWTVLAFELAVAKARGTQDSSVTKGRLLQSGVLMEGEWQHMIPGDRHTTVFYWMTSSLNRLYIRTNVIHKDAMKHVYGSVLKLQVESADLMSCVDHDLPYPYVHLVHFIVKALLIFNMCSMAISYRLTLNAHGDNSELAGAIVIVVANSFFFNFLYQGIVDLHATLTNPFGHRRLDINHSVLASTALRTLALNITKGDGPHPGKYHNSPKLVPSEVAQYMYHGVRPGHSDEHPQPSGRAVRIQSANSVKNSARSATRDEDRTLRRQVTAGKTLKFPLKIGTRMSMAPRATQGRVTSATAIQ